MAESLNGEHNHHMGGSPRADSHQAYPTDAKEREKQRRKQEKEQGIEKVVKKRKKVCEDHYDDCGDDLSSLHDKTHDSTDKTQDTFACDFDIDDALSDQNHDECMRRQFKEKVQSFPIDITKVAKAQTGSTPARGPDPRAAKTSETACPGCRHARARNDWEHTREI